MVRRLSRRPDRCQRPGPCSRDDGRAPGEARFSGIDSLDRIRNSVDLHSRVHRSVRDLFRLSSHGWMSFPSRGVFISSPSPSIPSSNLEYRGEDEIQKTRTRQRTAAVHGGRVD